VFEDALLQIMISFNLQANSRLPWS